MEEALKNGDEAAYEANLSTLMAQKMNREGMSAVARQTETGSTDTHGGASINLGLKYGQPDSPLHGSIGVSGGISGADGTNEANVAQGEGYRAFLKAQVAEDFAKYQQAEQVGGEAYANNVAGMIVAETNDQAEQWVAGAAGQVTRASADQEVTHNTMAQDFEDGAERGWNAAKKAAADLVDRGPEAVTDAYHAASNKFKEARNSVDKAWDGLWGEDKDNKK